jgi:D-alanyl-D-alanine carboxypeptidase (penicillin-binding protein 5/6)
VSAASYVVADLDTGAVLAAKDPHGRYAPASTLKVLTAVTLIPRLPASRVVTGTAADANVEGSKVGVVPRTRYRVDELFLALMMVSGNDAANALASAAGGVPTAVAAMNAEARRLHALDTVARTPSGLDAAGQATSAYDLALVTRAGFRLPDFRRYVTTRRAVFPAPGGRRFQISTHNRLLLRYPGAVGVKNGYTSTARASFVGAARRGDRTLVVTLLKAQPRVWDEAGRLLDWGFAAGGRVPRVGRLVDPEPGPMPQASAAPHAASLPVPSPAPPDDRSPLALLGVAALLASGLVGLRLRARERAPARAGRHRRTPLPPI